MFRLALRNLFQNRLRMLFSVSGVGLALLLTISLSAIVAGYETQLTAYVQNSGADVWVSQAGVRNLHMASSTLPDTAAEQVRGVQGVQSVTPILYMSNMVDFANRKRLSYVIGLPPDPAAGTAPSALGTRVPASGTIVVDRLLADQLGARMGDQVEILGSPLTIAGLSDGTASIINFVSFVTAADFRRIRPTPGATSYLLVKGAPGQSPAALAERISRTLPAVTVQTTAQFANSEKQIVHDMSTDVINVMSLVGFLIALAVMALTVYVATRARSSEYGVIKAVGGSNADLYRVVLWQALMTVALGYVLAVVGSLLLAAAVPLVEPLLSLVISPESLLRTGGFALVIAALAAVLPIRQLAGLDPVKVFSRRYA